MKNSVMLILLLLTMSVKATTGSINIRGKIIEVGCNFGVVQGSLDSECYHNGEWLRQSQPLAGFTTGTVAQQTVHTQLIWLDKEQRTGVIVVSYN